MPHKDPEARKTYAREWARRNRRKRKTENRSRDHTLRMRYGISEAEWNDLFEKQGNRCAICRTSEPKSKVGWHTDHDHQTGVVRGILCENCNRGLGMYAEDITFLARAASYLGVHKGVFTGDTIENKSIFTPYNPRTLIRGMSYGKSHAGYDIRLDQDITLAPKQFALGSSMEYFDIPHDCLALVCDKSSHARRGLSLFNTVAEPGWRGYLTLELFNASDDPICLTAGDPIAQVIFLALDHPTDQPYRGKYQDQPRGPQEAIEETS